MNTTSGPTDVEALAAARAENLAAIERVKAAHQRDTQRAVYHLGPCARQDLHDQLTALYAEGRLLSSAGTRVRPKNARRRR